MFLKIWGAKRKMSDHTKLANKKHVIWTSTNQNKTWETNSKIACLAILPRRSHWILMPTPEALRSTVVASILSKASQFLLLFVKIMSTICIFALYLYFSSFVYSIVRTISQFQFLLLWCLNLWCSKISISSQMFFGQMYRVSKWYRRILHWKMNHTML